MPGPGRQRWALGLLLWASAGWGTAATSPDPGAVTGTVGLADAFYAGWSGCLAQADPLACTAAREARLLARLNPAQVRRKGPQLQLIWPSGTSLNFTDEAQLGRFLLVGPLQPRNPPGWLIAQWPPSATVTTSTPGAPRYWLAAMANPAPLGLAGLPHLSPQARLLLTLNDASAELSAGRVLDLWQLAERRWSRIFHYEAPPGGRFAFRQWRADGAAVRLTWLPGPNCKAPAQPIQLRDGPYGWDFAPAQPAAATGC